MRPDLDLTIFNLRKSVRHVELRLKSINELVELIPDMCSELEALSGKVSKRLTQMKITLTGLEIEVLEGDIINLKKQQ